MPTIKKKKKTNNKKAINERKEFILNEDSPFAMQEAYKTLRTNVLFSAVGEECKTVLITSSLQGEAKSTTAVNLALSFAQNGNKVLLIDGDLRLPTVASKLDRASSPGLTDVLVGQVTVGEALVQMHNGLDFIPAGQLPPNPSELLGSTRMKRLLEGLAKRYEYIVIDTPPICTVADAAILSAYATGVILVVRQNVATKDSVSDAIQRLELAEAKIMGFVFTDVTNEKLKSYKSSYGYGYGHVRAKAKNEKRHGHDGSADLYHRAVSEEKWLESFEDIGEVGQPRHEDRFSHTHTPED